MPKNEVIDVVVRRAAESRWRCSNPRHSGCCPNIGQRADVGVRGAGRAGGPSRREGYIAEDDDIIMDESGLAEEVRQSLIVFCVIEDDDESADEAGMR